MKKLLLFLVALSCAAAVHAQEKSTHLFAQRDTCSLYLDLYMPADSLLDAGKPLVLFVFGGGFVSGSRDAQSYIPWFKELTDNGYPVASIDYRLGLKGVKYSFSLKFAGKMESAVNMAVEDLCSATAYLLDNAHQLGLAGRGIVTAGSSAGAITVLQAEYCIANELPLVKELPAGFNYAGVMAFSGAVFSRNGRVKYKNAPCPQLLFHGTADGMVPYKQIRVFNQCFGGSSHIAKSLDREGRNYQVWRFKDRHHEVAISMSANLERELNFMEHNVMNGENIVIDALIDDATLPVPTWATTPAKSFFK